MEPWQFVNFDGKDPDGKRTLNHHAAVVAFYLYEDKLQQWNTALPTDDNY